MPRATIFFRNKLTAEGEPHPPVVEDIIGYAVSNGAVMLGAQGGTEYIFPLDELEAVTIQYEAEDTAQNEQEGEADKLIVLPDPED